MRRMVVFFSSLFATTAAYLASGSAAFAMRAVPPSGGSGAQVAHAVHHSAGLEPWQVALIAFAGVVVLTVTVLGARLKRLSNRYPSPATT